MSKTIDEYIREIKLVEDVQRMKKAMFEMEKTD